MNATKRKIMWNVYYSSVCVLFLLSKSYCNEMRIESNLGGIHYRKCCKENQVYEFTEDQCVDRNRHELENPNQYFPVNNVHEDISV